jgi:Tfp pilus assembly protein PilO
MAKEIRTTTTKIDARAGVRRFIVSRQRSALGLPEMIALASAALLLLAALSSYFLLLRPQRARAEALRDEQTRLERQLQAARSEGQQSESTQASVERILVSLRDFEEQHLGENTPDSTTVVIKKLNDQIHRHRLRISGGLAFTPFEPRGAGAQPARTTGVSKPIQAVYPGIGISVSVEGRYDDLRRFIRDVESDERFVVINAIELESITDASTRNFAAPAFQTPEGEALSTPAPAPAAPTARGAFVSLRLDMAAYFRRPGAAAEQTVSGASGATR